MFANLSDRNSIDGGSSVHTAEVKAHDADEGSLGHKSTSPLGMPYFHELKEIQQQIQSVYASFPMQKNNDFLVSL